MTSTPSIDPAVFQRDRRKRLLRRLAAIGVVMVLTLVLIEVLLRITDPFGVVYFHDIARNFYDVSLPDQRGYVVAPGEYQASHWSFNILPDNTRAVPDTSPEAENTMVFIGDSITFGYGVDDHETWVNLVAREFPDWHVINDSYPGWSIENLEGAWEMHPDADLIFVLTITNDSDEPKRVAGVPGWKPTYIQLYATMITYLLRGFPMPSEETIAALEPAWREAINRIGADPRVTFIVINVTGTYDDRVMEMFPDKTVRIENYTDLISTVDSHANPTGNAFVAEQVVPLVRERIAAWEAGQ
jgi:hypothetical protein